MKMIEILKYRTNNNDYKDRAKYNAHYYMLYTRKIFSI